MAWEQPNDVKPSLHPIFSGFQLQQIVNSHLISRGQLQAENTETKQKQTCSSDCTLKAHFVLQAFTGNVKNQIHLAIHVL